MSRLHKLLQYQFVSIHKPIIYVKIELLFLLCIWQNELDLPVKVSFGNLGKCLFRISSIDNIQK